MRTVETKKFYLIRAIWEWLHMLAEKYRESLVLVIALTGVVAFNINRVTIHSTLFILIINDKKYNLNSIYLKNCKKEYKS